jgi:NAD+ kinase
MMRHVTPERVDRVGVVVHPRRDLDDALRSLRAWAAGSGADVVQLPMAQVDRVVAEPATADSCDVVLALGGDGTTLAALHAAGPAGKPVLGVACGSLGALTATSSDQLDEALQAFAAGAWEPRSLPGIAVTADGGPPAVALNDFVVVRKGASQIAVAIDVDGERFVHFAGDGIVIATPLGSSAYTMAAGGPVLAHAESIVLTPLSPHGGTCPPLVVGHDSEVKVSIEPGHYGARIELDGHVHEHTPTALSMSWQPDYATLVSFPGAESLLAGLRRRRILMDSPRVLARDERAAAVTRR